MESQQRGLFVQERRYNLTVTPHCEQVRRCVGAPCHFRIAVDGTAGKKQSDRSRSKKDLSVWGGVMVGQRRDIFTTTSLLAHEKLSSQSVPVLTASFASPSVKLELNFSLDTVFPRRPPEENIKLLIKPKKAGTDLQN